MLSNSYITTMSVSVDITTMMYENNTSPNKDTVTAVTMDKY